MTECSNYRAKFLQAVLVSPCDSGLASFVSEPGSPSVLRGSPCFLLLMLVWCGHCTVIAEVDCSVGRPGSSALLTGVVVGPAVQTVHQYCGTGPSPARHHQLIYDNIGSTQTGVSPATHWILIHSYPMHCYSSKSNINTNLLQTLKFSKKTKRLADLLQTLLS